MCILGFECILVIENFKYYKLYFIDKNGVKGSSRVII